MATKKDNSQATQGRGRPSKYSEEFHPLLGEALARIGLTDKQIALRLGISEPTLNAWKKQHPDFFASLKRGKEEPDDLVEQSLFRRATGFDNDKAVKIFMPAGADKPIYAPYTERVHPDVTACIFWLKNRRPERWRDKQDLSLSGELNHNVKHDLSKLTDAEIEALERIHSKLAGD